MSQSPLKWRSDSFVAGASGDVRTIGCRFRERTSALSRGTNQLLRLGAAPVTCAADVLEALGLEPPPAREPPTLEPRLEQVRVAVADAATTANEIARLTGANAGAIAAALAELELLGLIVESEGVYRAVR